ncbi:hypothetical protein Hanom_Chr01g00052451 [Helianthus anomalus]
MNVDFLETKYVYNTQLSGQGENKHTDTLSWLTQLPSLEEVELGKRHSTPSQSPSNTTTQSAEGSTTKESPSNVIPEVRYNENSEYTTSYNYETIREHTVPTKTEPTEDVEPDVEHVEQVVPVIEDVEPVIENVEPGAAETTERYSFSPRENRGVPPKRYSPEKVTPRSRNPVANIATGNLSNEA